MKVISTLKNWSSALLLLCLPALSWAQCEADFSYADYAGPLPQVGGITFTNLSSGDFTYTSWNFGDGNVITEAGSVIDHFYDEGGYYNVTLSVWSDDISTCFAEYTTQIFVMITDDPCDQLDCVWPGDANGDTRADLQDLLNIGLGFEQEGPAREDASNEWYGQPAEDWIQETADGVNYKHLDCNGDGVINQWDIIAVNHNYVQMENGTTITESGGAPLYLEFDVDTIYINDITSETVEINAGLMFGRSDYQLDNVHGLAFYLTFDHAFIVEDTMVAMDYNETSFFGDPNQSLYYAIDGQDGQVDAAVTRKNSSGAAGYGRLANFSFIIDSDIIDGRVTPDGSPTVLFEVDLSVVGVIDDEGNEVDVSLSEESAQVVFIKSPTTRVNDPELNAQIEMFPNPAKESVQVDLGSLDVQELEVVNLLGQSLYRTQTINPQMELDLRAYEAGIYFLQFRTEQGTAIKRLVVE